MEKEPNKEEPEVVWMYAEDWVQYEANIKEAQTIIDGTETDTR